MFPISPVSGHIQTCEDVERRHKCTHASLRSSIDMSKLNVSACTFVPALVHAVHAHAWACAHTISKPKAWAAEPRRVIVVAQPDAVLEIERMHTEFDLIFPWLRATKCVSIMPPVCTDDVYTAIVYAAFIQHALSKCENVPRTHICVISAHGGDYKTVSDWMRALGVDIHTVCADIYTINVLKRKDICLLTHDELMQLRDIDVEKKTKLRYNPWLRVVETL